MALHVLPFQVALVSLASKELMTSLVSLSSSFPPSIGSSLGPADYSNTYAPTYLPNTITSSRFSFVRLPQKESLYMISIISTRFPRTPTLAARALHDQNFAQTSHARGVWIFVYDSCYGIYEKVLVMVQGKEEW